MLRDEALCSEGKSLLPLALDEPDTNYQGKGAVFYQVVIGRITEYTIITILGF